MKYKFLLSVGLCILAVNTSIAGTYNTPSGSYQTYSYGNTTHVIQTGRGSGPTITPTISVPSNSTQQVYTPSGSYLIINNGSTTSVIQTGKTK